MSRMDFWCTGERMRADEIVAELRGWKAGESDDAQRQHWLMQKSADKIEHLTKMLDSYTALAASPMIEDEARQASDSDWRKASS